MTYCYLCLECRHPAAVHRLRADDDFPCRVVGCECVMRSGDDCKSLNENEFRIYITLHPEVTAAYSSLGAPLSGLATPEKPTPTDEIEMVPCRICGDPRRIDSYCVATPACVAQMVAAIAEQLEWVARSGPVVVTPNTEETE